MKLRMLWVYYIFLMLALPTLVFAQELSQNGPGSPDMQQARDEAKAAAMNDLTVDHRTAVQTIVQNFDAGSVSMSDAAGQIDALLTSGENKAVLAEAQKFMETMRQARPEGGPPGGGMGGPPPPGGGFHHNHKPDAGRFLLMVSASPDALRQALPSPP